MNVFMDIIWPIIDLLIAGSGIAVIAIMVFFSMMGEKEVDEWLKKKHVPITCGKLFVVFGVYIAFLIIGAPIFFKHFPELYDKSVFRIFNFVMRFV